MPQLPPRPEPEEGAPDERQLWLSVGGDKRGGGQTSSHTRAAPREHGEQGGQAGRGRQKGVARQFAQAGRAGKASGQGAVPLLALYADRTRPTGKSAASLGPGSETLLGSSLVWYGLPTTTRCWLYRLAAMRLQREKAILRRSKGTSGHWGDWLKDREHR